MEPITDLPMVPSCPLPTDRGYDMLAMLVVLALFSLVGWWWRKRRRYRRDKS